MSFAALRQTVLQAHALGTDKFAEDVEIDGEGGNTRTVRVKITHEQAGPRSTSRGARSVGRLEMQGTFAERERIQVVLSRDPTYAKSYPSRPQPATALRRAEAIDADRRPFTFQGEVVFEGDQHACYVFERPRLVVQGRE